MSSGAMTSAALDMFPWSGPAMKRASLSGSFGQSLWNFSKSPLVRSVPSDLNLAFTEAGTSPMPAEVHSLSETPLPERLQAKW